MTRSAKFEIDSLQREPETIARLVAADRLFAWLSRSVDVPPGWSALVQRAGQDPSVVTSGQSCEHGDVVDVLFVRTTSFECSLDDVLVESSDGHACHGSLRVRLSAPSERADLSALRKVLLGSSEVVTVGTVRQHLEWALRKVLTDLAGSHRADSLVSELSREEVRRHVEDVLGSPCLAAGLLIEDVSSVLFRSPAYREYQREQADLERQREREAARERLESMLRDARARRMTDVVQMLEGLEKAASERKDISLPDLFQFFSDTERGHMFEAMWQLGVTAGRTRYVAVLSGSSLLLFSPSDWGQPAIRVSLPDSLGGLRSVTADARSIETGCLLVGAATGVFVVGIDDGQVRSEWRAGVAAAQRVKGGVNRSAMSDDRVFATHSELGVMAWARDAANDSAAQFLYADLTTGAEAVRCIQIAHGRVWFAVDDTLWAHGLDGEGAPVSYGGSPSVLSAVHVAEGTAYAGNMEGQIIAWSVGLPDKPQVVRGQTGRPVESVSVMRMAEMDRLVVADRSNALISMLPGESFLYRHEGGSYIVRRAAVAGDLLAAMNEHRDRLILWDPREPARPQHDLIIPHLTGHRIQDLCLVPAQV